MVVRHQFFILIILFVILRKSTSVKYLDTVVRNPSSSSSDTSGPARQWTGIQNIQSNNDNDAYADLAPSPEVQTTSRNLYTGGYGFFLPYAESVVDTIDCTLQVGTDNTAATHVIREWRLRKPNDQSSDLSNPNFHTFSGSPSLVVASRNLSTLGFSLSPSELIQDSFQQSWRHDHFSGSASRTFARRASLAVTFSLDVRVTGVVPSSKVVNFNNWNPAPKVIVTGQNFYNMTPEIICKFGPSEITFGTVLNKTAIECSLPPQPQYRSYSVVISLRNNLYTNDLVAFTYVCDSATLCNGNGTCNETGGCLCFPQYKGPTCNIRACGDGIIDLPLEQCDDMNLIENDGCNSTCHILPGWTCTGAPSVCRNCGNGIVEAGEACDDGNTNPFDGCSNCTITPGWTCTPGSPSICNLCGDGILQGNETCDDNGTIPLDGCNQFCQVENGWICTGEPSVCRRCGDGVLQTGEQCDDSNVNNNDGCSSTCQLELGYICPTVGSRCITVCGDGIIVGNETCDTGSMPSPGCVNCNRVIGWNCTNAPSVCTTVCGDGIIVGSEECDNDPAFPEGCVNCTVVDGYSCSGQPSICRFGCGNNVTNDDEECDDGNDIPGIFDGCTRSCRIYPGWVCNNTNYGSICSEVCGNGIITINEGCDSGNSTDGCQNCAIVDGWECALEPSRCFKCGNGILEYPELNLEQCDDGNTIPGDGCSDDCMIESGYSCFDAGNRTSICSICGDGILDTFEQCDDGNQENGDGCTSQCLIEIGWNCTVTSPSNCAGVCGDGNVTRGEECDDMNNLLNEGCVDCKITPGYVCSGQPSVCQERCGNFFVTPSEECDDGNRLNNDGCDSECNVETGWNCTGSPSVCNPICGNGIVTNQDCDDGNNRNGDGCSSTCNTENGWSCTGSPSKCETYCGDGIIVGDEECDDENNANADGCSSACIVENGWNCTGSPSSCAPYCGDGIRRGNEACDDGNRNNGDGCSSVCTVEVGYVCDTSSPSVCRIRCGDGLIRGDETCDDANTIGSDGCSSDCRVEDGWTCAGQPSRCVTRCGDASVVFGFEECDDGNVNIDDGCNGRCEVEDGWTCLGSPSICLPVCGDGRIFGFEGCDDGNIRSGDGCSSNCFIEVGWYCENRPSDCTTTCGDGLRAGNETCDDGFNDGQYGCTQNCTLVDGWACLDFDNKTSSCFEVCGDGIKTESEACDDGNIIASDGCSNDCKIEDGYTCTGTRPSVCTALDALLRINKNDDTTLILAIVIPILFMVFSAVGLAAFFILRKRTIILKKPDFTYIAFGDVAAEPVSDTKKDLLAQLEKLLIDDSFTLVSSVCDTTAITEIDKLAKALVYVFYANDKAFDLLKQRISQEIKMSESQNTLFRSDSMGSKIFASYAKIVGLEYLWDTLGLIMFELTKLGSKKEKSAPHSSSSNSMELLGGSLEVDPNKMSEGEDKFANTLQLQLYSHNLWKVIIDSESKIPSEFRDIFHMLAEEIPHKYSDRKAIYKAVGGFFFLRFVCPAVTSPHVFGLSKDPPNDVAQRHLVLLSKILQCIANGTLPGHKESYMESMNGFIESHIVTGIEFFERISQATSEKRITVENYQLPEALRTNSLLLIYKHINLVYAKLAENLETQSNGRQIKSQLDIIMQRLSDL